jgi:hypothetical protein
LIFGMLILEIVVEVFRNLNSQLFFAGKLGPLFKLSSHNAMHSRPLWRSQ